MTIPTLLTQGATTHIKDGLPVTTVSNLGALTQASEELIMQIKETADKALKIAEGGGGGGGGSSEELEEVKKIASCGMPSDSYVSLTLGQSGSTYTMTKTGCIALSATFNTDGVIYVYRSKAPRYGVSTRYIASQWVDICLNAKKDEVITVQYSGSATVHAFNLIYAEGAK